MNPPSLVGGMNLAQRIRAPIDLQSEFRYAFVELLGGRTRQIAPQLFRPGAREKVNGFIAQNFPIPAGNVVRRFLAGEFTDGQEVVHIPTLQRLDVEKLLRALDVITAMATEHDQENVATENDDDAHRNINTAENAERHHGGNRGDKNRGRGRKNRSDHTPASSG